MGRPSSLEVADLAERAAHFRALLDQFDPLDPRAEQLRPIAEGYEALLREQTALDAEAPGAAAIVEATDDGREAPKPADGDSADEIKHARPNEAADRTHAASSTAPVDSEHAEQLNVGAAAPDVQDSPELAAAMERVECVVGEHFPESLNGVKANLAVAAVGCISDNDQPTSLVHVATSGAGKTLSAGLMLPDNAQDPLNQYVYRSDQITAASFVSHKADAKASQLASLDLLPKIKDKTLITKELAPIFAGKREELLERFARLASVLDGMGYISDSGAQGRRGYAEPINFQWIGCTTPLSSAVICVMAQLGPRLLFYNADRPRKEAEQLAKLGAGTNKHTARRACHDAVRDFLLLLYQTYPTRTIPSERIAATPEQLRVIALWSDALTRLRADVPDLCGEDVELPAVGAELRIEHAERVQEMLLAIARGSALAHGRCALNDYDLAQIAHIALSSGIAARSQVFDALLRCDGGTATTSEIQRLAGFGSKHTALRGMRELAALGLARFTTGTPHQAACAELLRPFVELSAASRHKAAAEGASVASVQ